MTASPKPLIPRAIHSRTGTVVVLRVPVGTPKEVADRVKKQAVALASSKPVGIRKKKLKKGEKHQISLF